MSQGALPKAYEFSEVESHWYKYWEEQGFFRADEKSAKPPFSIVIPPPNVTGQLHMGHALNNTLQDIRCATRAQGLRGSCGSPEGSRGIATQTWSSGSMRTGDIAPELGREIFLQRIGNEETYGGIIINH